MTTIKPAQDHELEAFLGEGFTPTQVQTITDRYRTWETSQTLPDTDDDDTVHTWRQTVERTLTAIAADVDGTAVDQLDDLGRERAALRARLADLDTYTRPLVWATVTGGTLSEHEAARVAGVDRMTVRKILGKR